MNYESWIIVVLLLVLWALTCYFMRRYYREKMKRVNKRAQKSEQLKSVFIDNVSRFLRLPLNAILGYSNMIYEQERASKTPSQQIVEMATNINENSRKLLDFTGKLLELTKFEGITPSFTFIEVNLTELFASYRREALNLVRPDVNVRVTTDLSPHCKGWLDTNFMHQLMLHILTNAAHNISSGDILIRYGRERHGIKVSVSYTGIGQSQLVSGDIYSLLQQEDALTHINETSALGLSICKAIVDVLEGEFYMDAEYDKKTVATFWFPCHMRDMKKDF